MHFAYSRFLINTMGIERKAAGQPGFALHLIDIDSDDARDS
jgi:hypothetical protein